MSNSQKLEERYLEFLNSQLNHDKGKELCKELERMGLNSECQALTLYLDGVTQQVLSFQESIWEDCRCFIGSNKPSSAQVGDLWFDIVELVPMILVSSAGSDIHPMNVWVSIRPVYTWQFRTFAKLIEWQLIRKDFLKVDDLFNLDRWNHRPPLEFIGDIYHEEAAAYAHWFGKQLSGQFILEIAKETIKKEQFSSILPENRYLWDEAEYSLSEFVRIAISQANINKDPDDEFELREEGQNSSIPDRILYEEWERISNIGCLTIIPQNLPLMINLPRRAYEFVEMTNSAPRF